MAHLVAQAIDIPETLVQYVDDNVAKKLPPGSRIKGISPFGSSYWTRTAEIQTEQADGSPLSFFLKVAHYDIGKGNLAGEFASMTAIFAVTPNFVPTPIALGGYASDDNVHFFLCSFVDMTDEPAELGTLPVKLAELHQKAVSPNGRFGFPIPTYQGALKQPNLWTDSWEKFFTDLMIRLLDWEVQIHGPDEELERLSKALVEKVIPRLLRPLETEGREIYPRLVHGDLWDGNTSTDVETDRPVIFDASSMYAHNEYELGAWRPPRHQIHRPYIKAYQKYFPISAPEEDSEDRLLLYCIRFDVTSSACYLDNLRFRHIFIEEMRILVEKFPNGYEGSEKQRAERDAP